MVGYEPGVGRPSSSGRGDGPGLPADRAEQGSAEELLPNQKAPGEWPTRTKPRPRIDLQLPWRISGSLTTTRSGCCARFQSTSRASTGPGGAEIAAEAHVEELVA